MRVQMYHWPVVILMLFATTLALRVENALGSEERADSGAGIQALEKEIKELSIERATLELKVLTSNAEEKASAVQKFSAVAKNLQEKRIKLAVLQALSSDLESGGTLPALIVYNDERPIAVAPPGRPLLTLPATRNSPKLDLRAVSEKELYELVMADKVPADLVASYPGFLPDDSGKRTPSFGPVNSGNATASGSYSYSVGPLSGSGFVGQQRYVPKWNNPVEVQRDIFNNPPGSSGAATGGNMNSVVRGFK